jgi:hypothetical protein
MLLKYNFYYNYYRKFYQNPTYIVAPKPDFIYIQFLFTSNIFYLNSTFPETPVSNFTDSHPVLSEMA